MCIRDRYQRRVRGTKTKTMSMAMPPSVASLFSNVVVREEHIPHQIFLIGLLIAAATWIACSRTRLDQWVVSKLLLCPNEDNIQSILRIKTVEKQNLEGRKMWVGVALLLVSGVSRMDVVGYVYVALIVPLALFSCDTSFHHKYGLVNQALQLAWLAVRLAMPNSNVDEEVGLFFTTMAVFLWNEVSMRSFSAVLLNHTLVNLAVAMFHNNVPTSLMLSLVMISVFCYRRSRGPDSCADLGHTCSKELANLKSTCSGILKLVLQSGDELCDDSTELLQEMLLLVTDGAQVELGGVGSGTSSELGAGTGSGFMVPTCSYGGQPPLPRDPGLNILAGMALDSDSSPDSTHTAGSSPRTQQVSRPEHSPGFPSLDSPPFPRHCLPMGTARHTQPQPMLPFAEELVRLSFDAMAQVQVNTGVVLWANQAFGELTHMVGGGDTMLGLQCLQARFLQQLSHQVHCLQDTVGRGSTQTQLRSASVLAGPPGEELVLWVLQSPIVRPQLGGGGCTPPNSASDSEADTCPATQHTVPAPGLGFPAASEHLDPLAKVTADPSTRTGRGRRPTLMLWQKYGQKALYNGAGQNGSSGSTVERLYYKCYKAGCKARLKIDVVQATRERVDVVASGVHCHHVTLAEGSHILHCPPPEARLQSAF
eukprot:TRINITY_DN16355_c0_g2_i3.p1 TRINITY_DN16355_c0_g2~~TRINITY_DN16355_c0_g2_i3.p1  ORF type:complete len:650 (+),score=155.40 TRINITY_DN16355_c0_g2_i3:139-2088(+)